MKMDNVWKPAIIGGILLGVLSSLPLLNCACCAWIIGGGFLAAYLYVKSSPFAVALGQGVVLGFWAGIIGTVIIALFSIPLILMILISPEGSRELADQIQQMMDQIPGFPAESRESVAELVSQEGFLKIAFFASIFAQLVINCLLAMLGGALGVAIFEKRKPGDGSSQTPDALPPPPQDTRDS